MLALQPATLPLSVVFSQVPSLGLKFAEEQSSRMKKVIHLLEIIDKSKAILLDKDEW